MSDVQVGVGSLGIQSAGSVAITGGAVAGLTSLNGITTLIGQDLSGGGGLYIGNEQGATSQGESVILGTRAGAGIAGGNNFLVIVGHDAGGLGTGIGSNNGSHLTVIGTDALRNVQGTVNGIVAIGDGVAENIGGSSAKNVFIGGGALGAGSIVSPISVSQSVVIGGPAAATPTNSGGLVLIGFNSDTTTSSTNNAVAIGGIAAGGQKGAVAASNSVVIGAQAGNTGDTGTNYVLIGLQAGHTTAKSGSNVVLIGTNNSIDVPTAGTSNYIGIAAGSTAVISATGCGTPSTSILTAAGSLVVNSATGGVTVGSSGPTLTSGAGAPSATQPVGSLYLNTGGSSGSRLYVSAGSGSWNAVAGV